jgi:Domain of unknown function (DUF4124)
MKFNLVFLIFIYTQTACGAEIHAWTDKDGRKHYTDKAPLNINEVKSTSVTEILSARSQESMRKAIELHRGPIFAKYMKALKKNSSLNGKFTVRLSVEPSGLVNQAVLIKSELRNPELESELLSEFNSINFGKERVKESSINYTIDFLSQ